MQKQFENEKSVFEVQSAIRPDSPPSGVAVVKGRIPVSGVEGVREVAGDVEKKLESACPPMPKSAMTTTNENDF